MNPSTESTSSEQENPFISLLLNLIMPVLFLKKGQSWLQPQQWLGVSESQSAGIILVVALAFPVSYFVYDYFKRGKKNFVSVLGFVSVLLTGGIGVLQLSRTWLIIKEGGIPLIIGLVLLASLKTRYPLIKTFLYNENLLDVNRINTQLEREQKASSLDQLMKESTWLIAASFFFSSAVQFILTGMIVTVEPSENPQRFNEQVGDMTWITYLVILVPSMSITFYALYRLVKGLEKLTGLKFESLLAPHIREKSESTSS
mgnify:CR=1 FL=1